MKCKGNYPEKAGNFPGRLVDAYNPEKYQYFEYCFTGDKNQWDRNYPFGEWLNENQSHPSIESLKQKYAEHLGVSELDTRCAAAVEWTVKNINL